MFFRVAVTFFSVAVMFFRVVEGMFFQRGKSVFGSFFNFLHPLYLDTLDYINLHFFCIVLLL